MQDTAPFIFTFYAVVKSVYIAFCETPIINFPTKAEMLGEKFVFYYG